jgi:ABC-type bacteriocin/lantibiotic exporter with double-glycine peptidase domain
MKRRVIALFGLCAMLGSGGVLLGIGGVFSSPEGVGTLSQWRLGAKFLGTEGVVMQDKRNNCGPAALKMILDAHGIRSELEEIEQSIHLTAKGSSMLSLKKYAEAKGLKAEGWRLTLEAFLKAPKPMIVFIEGDHFAVVDSTTQEGEVVLRDPARGRLKLPVGKMKEIWNGETLVFQILN